eukprot:TRINITY_DN4851_c0_g1_i1.p1 TRINITY_DN4851_c0_g1~~TRINITY_DN4851_c0_g1_i1.p1  ORF type:complete len:164 (-),score=45.65 TRINITY_DN4851_c0_g1_i1:27-518(-)
MNGKIWAGHNIEIFDNRVLKNNFQDLNLEFPKPIACIDTLKIARNLKMKEVAGNCKLETLSKHYSISKFQKHRALSDVLENIKLFQCLSTSLFLISNLQVPFSYSQPYLTTETNPFINLQSISFDSNQSHQNQENQENIENIENIENKEENQQNQQNKENQNL